MLTRAYEYHLFLRMHVEGLFKIRRIHAQKRNCQEYVTAVTLLNRKDISL